MMNIRLIMRAITARNKTQPEDSVKKALKKIGGNIFLDVGANVGDYTILLLRNFSKVIALEPNPQTVVALKNRLQSEDKKPLVVESALADFDGETKFYLNQDTARASGSADTLEAKFHYRPASNPNLEKSDWKHKEITVKVQRLDSLVQTFSGSIDLVKIDVEGAEFRVLKGAEKTLSAGRIRRILIELHDRTRKEELENLLSNNRFSCRWLDADHIFGELKQ